jgi:hypothetical protein
LNKFFLLLLIGGLAIAYFLLTRPVPPETVGGQITPDMGSDTPVETLPPEPPVPATTTDRSDAITPATVAPAEPVDPAPAPTTPPVLTPGQ